MSRFSQIILGTLTFTFLMVSNPGFLLAERPPVINPELKKELVLPTTPGNDAKREEQYFGMELLPKVTQVVVGIGAATSVLFVIIGGIEILTAYGNDDRITSGKKTVTYALIGLVIATLSYAIVSIISALSFTAS